MDIPTEESQLGKRATAMRTLRALVISAVVVLILAVVAVKLYHREDEVLQEVKNWVSQRMTDVKGLWAQVDMSKYKDYITGLFTN